jgi:Methyltransferase domain
MTSVRVNPAGTIACVVDDDARFHLQAFRWFAALTRCAGIRPDQLTVLNAGRRRRSDVLSYLADRGVRVGSIDAFDSRSGHCNKIGALRAITAAADSHVVLSDCDVVFLSDPREFVTDPHALHAKPVDAPNPPLSVLEEVMRARRLPLGETHPLPLYPPEMTCAGNANGGVYAGEASWLNALAADWSCEARWLLERRSLLRQWAIHVDQLAMLLALRAGERRFRPLPLGANVPTHLASVARVPSPAIGPVTALHYHDRITAQGLLAHTGIAQVDRAIDRVNAAIAAEMAAWFPNATFWTWRYAQDPGLGSGVGSRNASLQQKRDMIQVIAAGLQPASTLDVGCGDGAAVDGLRLGRYLGVDIAPNAGFRLTDGKPVADRSIDAADSADLVLCLDVAIHEADARGWERLIREVVRASRSLALVSGYERAPDTRSPMVCFHAPLSDAIRRAAPDRWCVPVREDHQVVTHAVLTPPPRHPRDLRRETLAQLPQHLLVGPELVALLAGAWNTIGFFPDHLPRVWEYPAMLRTLRGVLAAGGSVLDVGAGINPLDPLLSRLGFDVTTVDPGPVRCPRQDRPRWNEWGFLDYTRLGLPIASVNGTLEAVPRDRIFDAIISVSVVEHLEAVDRRALLNAMRTRCHRGSHVALTVDICAGTDRLWNRSEGREVEPWEAHGGWDDIRCELMCAGFEIVQERIVGLGGRSPVDLGFVLARAVSASAA